MRGMKTFCRNLKTAMGCALGLWVTASAAFGTPDEEALSRLSSTVLAMRHSYRAPEAWAPVIEAIDALIERAEANDDDTLRAEAGMLRARVDLEVFGREGDGIARLERLTAACDDADPQTVDALYLLLAERYAGRGDEDALVRLGRRYRSRPAYRPERYAHDGGQGAREPLRIVRPTAWKAVSTVETAIQQYIKQARSAPGSLFPSFELKDTHGRTWRSDELRGQKVVLDCWVRGASSTQARWSALKALRGTPEGDVVILGIGMDGASADEAERCAAREGLSWPQIAGERALTAKLGLFGEPALFILDEQGLVLARNPKPGEIADILRANTGDAPP